MTQNYTASSAPGKSRSMAARPAKILMIRLSSLGDVILASTALSAVRKRSQMRPEVHWVVSREYASLLAGHPTLTKIWEFDKKLGLKGWLKLCSQLWAEGFTEVNDLHSTLRSRVAWLYFFLRGAIASVKRVVFQGSREKLESRLEPSNAQVIPIWRTVSKQRLRLYGYFVFKSLWPKSFRPTPLVKRFSLLVGGSGDERPDLHHLVDRIAHAQGSSQQSGNPVLPNEFIEFAQQPYLCVMPSSRWNGKKWAVRNFFEVIRKHGLPVVVLGSRLDRESQLLAKLLDQSGLRYFSGIGRFDFPQLAAVLAFSKGYLGNDTGLAHLAEAVGSNAVMIFGPTRPEMGFGPWKPQSQSVSAKVWCSPCGKDGRFCYRFTNRYACQKLVLPQQVLDAVHEIERV